MNKNQISIATTLVVLAVGATWAMGFFSNRDPQLVELEQLRDENFEKMPGMSEEERRKQFGTMRNKVGDLSEEQRHQFFENSRPMFLQMMNQRIDSFFAKSPQEQAEELDRRIDRMVERNANRDNTVGNQDRGNRGGNMTPQQRDQRRKERLDRTTPELRGKMDRYLDMLNERRAQRGLEPVTGRRAFGGRGGPR